MKAVMLAAGVGRRLGIDHPKCLLAFGSKTLLRRHLETLSAHGIHEIVIAVGFRSELIEEEIRASVSSTPVRTVYNARYERGSVLSLWSVRQVLREGDDVLLMDADVLYRPDLLQCLIHSKARNCFLIDRAFEPGDEPVKFCVRDGRPVEFRKRIAAGVVYDFCGESVGFFRFSGSVAARLAERADYYHSAGLHAEPYEEAIRDLVLETPEAFGFEDVSGVPWIEIDFPEDVYRAEREILPRLVD
ncbi:MAG: NTP transferase domain-containing protein [Gammaproteobacteria bacterium]